MGGSGVDKRGTKFVREGRVTGRGRDERESLLREATSAGESAARVQQRRSAVEGEYCFRTLSYSQKSQENTKVQR